MTNYELFSDLLNASKESFKDCKIDHNTYVGYIAVDDTSDTGFIIQGEEYEQFRNEVDEIYKKDTHSYNECIMIALEPYSILLID
jgi:hypothetical protein